MYLHQTTQHDPMTRVRAEWTPTREHEGYTHDAHLSLWLDQATGSSLYLSVGLDEARRISAALERVIAAATDDPASKHRDGE